MENQENQIEDTEMTNSGDEGDQKGKRKSMSTTIESSSSSISSISSSISSSSSSSSKKRIKIDKVEILSHALFLCHAKPGGLYNLFPYFVKNLDFDLDFYITLCLSKKDKMVVMNALARRFVVLGYL